ncbi:acetyl-coenzyme A transporter 1-domain-containing protein [Pelagophyceae sp. CCMP2097]|nr:acetyl-coenzyme A transporter 1-domain-containing protein [Pelagophyceae sp. CCMP2097]
MAAARKRSGNGQNGANKGRKPTEALVVSDTHDRGSVALLMVLYTLQGLPMGLSSAVPLLLAGKIAYKEQAVLAMASMPFSLKLLWAPLVDSAYIPSIGRRKTWLVPCQLLIGLLMVLSRSRVDAWVDGANGSGPQTSPLAVFFFALYALCATQDIAVDGWALTMLSEKNVGWASTCNSAGQSLGFALSYVGFVALHDEATCNKYLRAVPASGGLVSVATFVSGVGYVFLATTLFVAFCKHEKLEPIKHSAAKELYLAYEHAVKTLSLKPIALLCGFLLTAKAPYAAADAAVSLKCVELGFPKDDIAFLSPLLLVISIALPLSMAKLTAGPKPLAFYILAIPLRLALNPLYLVLLKVVAGAYAPEATYSPTFAFAMYAVLAILKETASNLMFVAQMAFFARVVDPAYGGTDLTLLNTVSNLGALWPPSVALYLLDVVKFGSFDALTVELAMSTILGLCWFAAASPLLLRLQDIPLDQWRQKP